MILKDILICDGTQYRRVDVAISSETKKIIKIDNNISIKDEKEISFRGKNIVIMPSFYDLNTRVKDDVLRNFNIQKIIKKAKKSGIHNICIAPDCSPAINTSLTLDMICKKEIIPICNALNKENLSEIATLLSKNAQAIYVNSNNSDTLKVVCQYANINNTPIFVNSFDGNLSDGCIHNHLVSSRLGLDGIDYISQSSAVARMIEIGRFFNSKIVFNNISSSRSIELISNNKNKNFITQVPIHHLILTDTQCENFNTIAKIFPPLKDEEERQKLIKSLKNKEIDILTSLQSHHNKTSKDLPFEDASFGANEITIYFALCFTHLVRNKIIKLDYLSRLLSANARAVFNKKPILVKENTSIKKLLLIDLDKSFKVVSENSMYYGKTLYSQVQSLSKYVKKA